MLVALPTVSRPFQARGWNGKLALCKRNKELRRQKEITCELIRSGFRIDCGPFRLYLLFGTAKRALSTISHPMTSS